MRSRVNDTKSAVRLAPKVESWFHKKAHEPVQMTCLHFFDLFFSLLWLNEKLQKRERTCRAYMKVPEPCFCLFLLAATPTYHPHPPPPFLCNCVWPPPQTAACTLFTVTCSLLSASLYFIPELLSICLIHMPSVHVHVCAQDYATATETNSPFF